MGLLVCIPVLMCDNILLQVTMGFEEPMEKRRRLDVVALDYGHGVDFQVKHKNSKIIFKRNFAFYYSEVFFFIPKF